MAISNKPMSRSFYKTPEEPASPSVPSRNIAGRQVSGTGFKGVRQLIGANQGVSGLGGRVEEDLKSKLKQTQFKSPVGASNIAQRQQTAADVLKKAQSGGQLGEEEVQSFQQAFKDYKGPTGLDESAQAAAETAQAAGRSSLGQLLTQQAGGGAKYGAGLRRFDEMLLKRDPRLEAIKQTQAQLKGAGERYETAARGAEAQAQQQIGEIRGLKEQYFGEGGLLASGQKSVLDRVKSTLSEKQKEADDKVSNLKSNLEQGKLTDQDFETLQALGLSADQALYGMTPKDLSKFISSVQYKPEDFMTQSELASLQALNKLAGGGAEKYAMYDPTKIKGGQDLAFGETGNLQSVLAEQQATIDKAVKDLGLGDYYKQAKDLGAKSAKFQQDRTSAQSKLDYLRNQAIKEGKTSSTYQDPELFAEMMLSYSDAELQSAGFSPDEIAHVRDIGDFENMNESLEDLAGKQLYNLGVQYKTPLSTLQQKYGQLLQGPQSLGSLADPSSQYYRNIFSNSYFNPQQATTPLTFAPIDTSTLKLPGMTPTKKKTQSLSPQVTTQTGLSSSKYPTNSVTPSTGFKFLAKGK